MSERVNTKKRTILFLPLLQSLSKHSLSGCYFYALELFSILLLLPLPPPPCICYMYLKLCHLLFLLLLLGKRPRVPHAFHFHFPDCLNGDNKPEQYIPKQKNKKRHRENRGRDSESERASEREKYRKNNDIVTPCYNLDLLDFMAESRLIEYMIVLFYFMFILLFFFFSILLFFHPIFFAVVQYLAIYFYY